MTAATEPQQPVGVKPLTLRLPHDLAEDLETVAMVSNQSMAEVVRVAIASYIAKRKCAREVS